MKSSNLSATDLIASLAAIVSLVALAVSVRSCEISQNAHNLSVLEYNNSRALILKGAVQENNLEIRVSPLDPEFLLQEVHYQFPSEFGTGRKVASPPNFMLNLNNELAHYRYLLKQRYEGRVQGRIIGEDARMPFLIETYSSVKGESFRSTALYTLNFNFEVFADSTQEPIIRLTGITFGSRIARDENPKALLEKDWKEALVN